MRHIQGLSIWLSAVVFLLFAVLPTSAADRDISLLPDADLPGLDYHVLRDVTLQQCEKACVSNRVCQAFTFDERAEWCFLKGSVADSVPFAGATSGVIVQTPSPDEIAAARELELSFPPASLIQSARAQAASLRITNPVPFNLTYVNLVASAEADFRTGNKAAARVQLLQALGINGNDPGVWLMLAQSGQAIFEAAIENGQSQNFDLAAEITSSALNAFLRSETVSERADALSLLAYGLEKREMWREAIATYRDRLALVDDAGLQERLDSIVAQHGFRVVSHEVDSEAALPRVCAVFSEDLPTGDTDLAPYLSISGDPRIAVEAIGSQICLEGVSHGSRYEITLRRGLPAASGEELSKDVTLAVFVPDREPFVGFANDAYVMPAGLGGGLPITSVNAESADISIYRIGDRSIATVIREGIFQSELSEYSAEDIADQTGELKFEGQIDLATIPLNQMGVTAIPVSEIITDIEPGAYVITAKVTGSQQTYWRRMATQWFIVSDLGLTEVSGADGLSVFVRSLTTAEPIADVHLKLVAVNNEVLGEATSGPDGRATFAPGLARGEGGSAPQLLVAETEAGDYAFLDISRPGFDLTDRGVAGRPSPGPLDLFATTERGVYRPGETVYLTALLRDPKVNPVAGLNLTVKVERPDGVLASEFIVSDKGAGSYFTALPLSSGAMRGSWHARFYADPNGTALADTAFLVEDFEPERLAFEIEAPEGAAPTDSPLPVTVEARYLYGAVAPDLEIEADAILRPQSFLSDYPGYVFGREDDTTQPDRVPLGVVATTDETGHAVAEIDLPTPRASTRPLSAEIILRLVDTNGRPVQRSLSRPVMASGNRIGVRPAFHGADLGDGAEAAFDIIMVSPNGETVSSANLNWSLSRITTRYQWYRDNGTWKWEGITSSRMVANGAIDTLSDEPVRVGSPVNWGRYRFEISAGGDNPTSSSYEFYAGYYYAESGSDTPDTLQVALDKSAYRVGDTAILKLEPQFAGTALVMVVDDRVIDIQAVDVPEAGTSVPLTVTEDWGPGAYVTAMLYRPADAAEKRMPGRSVGLAFAKVDPGERLLAVDLEVPEIALPRQAFTATVDLGEAVAGETAYVAVAAVDLGILNLTGFQPPDPDGYFYGQRQLGVDLRDLYGHLIDPTQGLPGTVRSGGDGGPARTGAPPPTSVLVALHSGIVTVGSDGTASVSFDMPDFSGTVRVMAMAWTDEAVGHAAGDVVVRDPVVVTLSPPRFVRIGDQTRLLVEIDNVSGTAGTYMIEMETAEGLSGDTEARSIDLDQGDRASLDLVLTGTRLGDHELNLHVTDPDGNIQTKSLVLGVRATSGEITRQATVPIAPGESLTLNSDRFEGMLEHTGSLTIAVGALARLNAPELLLSLDRYPYGCAEQVTSRALPLIYLDDVAEMVGIGSDAELRQRVDDAIVDLLNKQASNGAFGLWGPHSYSHLWLDAYVTDFLLRADAAGFSVPDEAMQRALDNLANQVSYAADFELGGEDLAYALYDLARAGRASIGDLRYFVEARLDNFATPLAKAQLGAALALYGERTRATEAFEAAVSDLANLETQRRYRSDYGSRLRDHAGVLALAAEFSPSGVDMGTLASQLAGLRDLDDYTSTQEEAWMLLAAAAVGQDSADGSVTIDGLPVTGPLYDRIYQEDIEAAPVIIANTGNRPTEVTIAVTAIPATPPVASSRGFTLTRTYYQVDGTPVEDLSAATQNDRFVVVLSAEARDLGSGQYVITDPLPAGFEIENPDLSAGSGVGDLSWLSVNRPLHAEARTDLYMAAFRFSSQTPKFSTAYLVRAVTPGTFTMPGAMVEDMYRPEMRANTAAGNIVIAPAGR